MFSHWSSFAALLCAIAASQLSPVLAQDLEPELIKTFDDVGSQARSLAFSRDGRFLALGNDHHPLVIFDAKNLIRVDQLSIDPNDDPRAEGLGGETTFTSCTFSPDGSKLLCGGDKGTVIVWSVSKDGQVKPLGKFVGHTGAVQCIAVSPDGKFALSGGSEKRFRYWQIESRKEIATYEVRGMGKACFIASDGRTAMATDAAKLLKINLQQGKVTREMQVGGIPSGRRGPEAFATFSTDGSLLAVAVEGDVRLWDCTREQQLKKLPPLVDVREVQEGGAFSLDGKHLVTRLGPQHVIVWDVSGIKENRESRRVATLETGGTSGMRVGEIAPVAISPDNNHFAIVFHTLPIGGLLKAGVQIFALHRGK
jgi:WD40 repeat protein